MKKILWRISAIAISALLLAGVFSGCAAKQTEYNPLENVETRTITDGAARKVEVPAEITKIAPSGATAQMILMTIAPEMLVGLSADPSSLQRPYFPESMWYLPTFGQFYGAKNTLNIEALVDAGPQIIIDLGDRKTTIKSDMDLIRRQTGIPTVFYEMTLQEMAAGYRELGKLLGKEEKAEQLAQFVEKTVAMAEEKAAMIPEDEKVTIMYGTGATGLAVNADESSQAQVIDLIGAKNAVIPDVVTSKGGGTTMNLESVYKVEPDMIILTTGGPFEELKTNGWCDLKAVQNDRYYEIPGVPYNWVSAPPSVNMVLGVWWLGQLTYPDIYNDYDIKEVAQEYYALFWNYELSDEEAEQLLAHSYYKNKSANKKSSR